MKVTTVLSTMKRWRTFSVHGRVKETRSKSTYCMILTKEILEKATSAGESTFQRESRLHLKLRVWARNGSFEWDETVPCETNIGFPVIPMKVAQSCLTSRPHGPYSPWIPQAKYWGSLPSPGDLPNSRDWTKVPHITGADSLIAETHPGLSNSNTG